MGTKLTGTNFKYTQHSCRNICEQLTVSEACNCTSIHHMHNVHFENSSIEKTNFCLWTYNQSNVIKTLENSLCEHLIYLSNEVMWKHKCNCQYPCEEIRYDTMVTLGQWQLSNAIHTFVGNYISLGSNQNRKFHLFNIMKKYPTVLLMAKTLYKVDIYELLNGEKPVNNLNTNQSTSGNIISEPNKLNSAVDGANTKTVSTSSTRNETHSSVTRATNSTLKSEKDIKIESLARVGFDPNLVKLAILGDQAAYSAIVGERFLAERKEWVYNSFFHVNVYFRDTAVTNQEQVPSVTLSDLWSSIGGILGLWAGVSVITVIEVVSLVGNLIKSLFLYGKVKKTPVEPMV